MKQEWIGRLPELRREFATNAPFPHLHLPDFLEDAVARRLTGAVPSPKSARWTRYRHFNQRKLGISDRNRFPPECASIVTELQSSVFSAWLSELTGIPGLVSEARMEGARIHQIERGGFLNVHVDSATHDHDPRLLRRVNLLIYLNPEWREDWHGDLELWDAGVSRCVKKYAPLFNHAVIFATGEKTFHGHPEPLACPLGVTRKSLALYYFTRDGADRRFTRPTTYRSRPEDAPWTRAAIWADNRMLAAYSRARARFGFKDF